MSCVNSDYWSINIVKQMEQVEENTYGNLM